MRILVGCCGVPGGLARYARTFPIVEINSTFYKLPRESTARRWRQSVPDGFVFCVKAFQGVTHPASSPTWRRFGALPPRAERFGWLRDTRQVHESWAQTLTICRALRARVALIQTPMSFEDDAANLANARKFFAKTERGSVQIAVELRGWSDESVRALCADFDLMDCRDPFAHRPVAFDQRRTAYLRLHGAPPGKRMYSYRYTAEDLQRLKTMVESLPVAEALLFFNNISMAADAAAFQRLAGL